MQIKKWLGTLPPMQRPRVHYLSDAQGLVWVEGLGAAGRCAVTEATQKMLVLRVCHRIHT